MEWFFERGGKQNGPVGVSDLVRMLDSGDLGLDTLVWRKGMDDWKPLKEVEVMKTESGEEMAVCAASGAVKPKSEMVPYGDRWVSPDHREEFVQQLMEGVGVEAGGDPSDYEVRIGHYLGRAWKIMSADFWPVIGVSAAIVILYLVASQLPFGGLLSTPLFAGLSYYLILKVRGKNSRFEDSLSGFNRNLWQLILLGLVSGLLMALSLIPGIIVVSGGIMAIKQLSEIAGISIVVLGAVVSLLPFVYLNTAWIFSSLLCIDKQIDFWPAMSISMKVVNKHRFSCCLFSTVLWLLIVAGILVLFFGVFFTVPWTLLALGCFYEDVFGRRWANELE